MTDRMDINQEVDNRFYNLLIGLSNAQEVAGVEVEGKVKAEQSEQFNARRNLLRIEKLAKRDMELNKRSEENFVESVRDKISAAVCERVELRLEDLEELYSKQLGIHEGLPELLDTLSVKATSIAKLEPLVAQISWLATDLLKLVNTPKYRKTDRLGRVVVVENLRIALSFLGIENLKMVIPSMVFRRAIPQITDPYPVFKAKIWEHAIGSAVSCQRIATLSKVDPGHAFILGMFHEFGKLIITKLYFKTFDEVHREALIEAHDDQKRDEHSALLKIGPTSDVLLSLMWKHSISLSSRIISHMGMRRVFIANAMEEFALKTPWGKMSPIAKVLLQGNGYSKYNMLKRYKLISTDEAKAFLKSLHMAATTVLALQGTDLRSLNLTMDDE
ncbi:HDOD domain-containing protein [Paraneptunicella aestuarii]|uniref:HDOD domain-containing protein n=1 Tax=Paraneptunicella aestuarii TaxID=2831148 RepID=UPI001E383545|nr:HDOD domain-containing protein [Paraneptunicella aestuarii]UAA38550.1 HDOD domain-containing protein [Paraneptunicella aestuarii]